MAHKPNESECHAPPGEFERDLRCYPHFYYYDPAIVAAFPGGTWCPPSPPAPGPQLMRLITLAPSEVKQTTAQLWGRAKRPAESSVTVFFRWRSKEVGGAFSETAPQVLTEDGEFSADLTGLTGATTYEFKAVIQWTDGSGPHEFDWWLVEFTTVRVVTQAATSVQATTATLHGTAGLGDESTVDVFFSWRLKEVGGAFSGESTHQKLTADGAFSANLTGLVSGENYEFQAVIQNGFGTEEGALLEFTTD